MGILTSIIGRFNFSQGLFLLGSILPLVAASQDSPVNPTEIITGVFLGETPPLRDLPELTETEKQKMHEKAQKKLLNPKIRYRSYPFADIALPKGPDPVWQREMGNYRESRAIINIFEGAETASYFPTDANGTIGPNHYMQTINTVYTIYNRAGVVVAGPTALNTLFYWLPGAEFNDGDPIVLYDEQADRWLVAEFSFSGNNDYMLIAVSTTNDPTGTWYKYSFDVTDKPDYEKFGIWQDGYYMGTNNPNGNDIYVFERSQMLSGLTAQMIGFDNPHRPTTWDGFMCIPPLDNDGPYAPEGEPGLFITLNDDAVSGGNDELWVYELDVDWTTPTNSTFARTQQISVAPFDSNFGEDYTNIKQPLTAPELDAISMVIMNPPQYRNFDSYETIVCCHTVDVDNTNQAGIRWYELRRVASGNWTVRQSGTYAPDAHSRWMGSIMLNGSNEIALGYSISSSTLYPGIRYCGQSSTAYAAANNNMDVAEEVILAGTYSQSSYARWGDYSSLQVDVADDETFWYTNQYIGTSNIRKTKIASFQIGTIVLTANFTASIVNPPVYSTVSFTDVSCGSPSSWNWSISPNSYNFINGTTSSSQNPQVQFTAAGNYSVTLTITNGTTNDTEIKTDFISVLDCGNLYLPFNEDFSDGVLPACWKNTDNVGNGHTWRFDNPSGWTINTPTGATGVAILDSYYYGVSYHQNADLITPLLDFSAYTTVNLYFQHYLPAYVTIPPYSAYGKLYYSINDGLSWTQLGSWAGTANATVYNQNLSSQVAGQSRVRFKWNYTGYGYFWAIDDISITGTGPNTWTGVTSADWSTASNWSAGTVPGSTSNVIIPSVAPNWPVVTGDFSLASSCDKMTLCGSSQLTVNGNITIPSGKTMVFLGDGQVNLSGNWINLGFLNPGNGTVRFTGNSPSSVNGYGMTSTITNYQRSTFAKGMTNLTGATAGPSGTNGSADVSIGFTFNYLGTNYSQAHLCTNGWISLNLSGTAEYSNATLFNATAPNTTLAPWFDYLTVDGSGALSYKTEGTAPNRVFTVEWKTIPTYRNNANARISFQVKLFETTNIIEFHYGNLVPGSHNGSESASVGIEDATGGSGHFIEATTGSSTTGVINLVSTTQWPTVNYRLSPPSVAQTFRNINVDKNGSYVDLVGSTTVNGNLSITNGTVSGPSSVSGHLNLKGNLINNGNYIPGSGTVVLNGSSDQNIGGSAVTSFTNLTINNPAGISLTNNQTVSGELNMTSGNIDCGSNILELGTSVSAVGSLSWTAGNITGGFKRWIASSTGVPIDFPVGTSTGNHKVRITFGNNTGGSLTAKFEPGDPGSHSGFPLPDGSETLNESDLYIEGSWTLIPTTLSSTNYALELSGTGFSSAGAPDETVRILKRPDGGGTWTADGNHVTGTAPVARRSGLSGFSRFMLAIPGEFKKISGNINYYNTANTPLTSGVTLRLYQGGSQVGSDFIVTNGTYEFSGLTPGDYEIRVSSSNPTEGSINTTDAAQVNYWGVNPYLIEKVRFYAGDVTGTGHYLNSTDALRIQNHFVNGTAFDKGNWAFWRTGETISSNSNPPEYYPQVSVSTTNINANLYGLCAGDFNRSFIPGTQRSAWSAPELIHTGTRLAGCNETVVLPLRIAVPCTLGAISLILDFPGELVEIRDVLMDGIGGMPNWSVRNNQLKISWFTENPIYFDSKDELFLLELKTTAAFTGGNMIRINLADDLLNELADGSFEAIFKPVLETDIIESGVSATNGPANHESLLLECRPNPFIDQATLIYSIPFEGRVTLEIKSMLGSSVTLISDQIHATGRYSIKISQATFAQGISIATLSLQSKNKTLIENLKLIKE